MLGLQRENRIIDGVLEHVAVRVLGIRVERLVSYGHFFPVLDRSGMLVVRFIQRQVDDIRE